MPPPVRYVTTIHLPFILRILSVGQTVDGDQTCLLENLGDDFVPDLRSTGKNLRKATAAALMRVAAAV